MGAKWRRKKNRNKPKHPEAHRDTYADFHGKRQFAVILLGVIAVFGLAELAATLSEVM